MSDVDDLFNDPGAAEKVEWEKLEGRLLLIYPEEKTVVPTADYGDKEAIRSRLVVLDGPTAPKDLPDILVFPLKLQGQLRGSTGTGRPVIGRLGKGPEKIKGNYPWILNLATDADKQKARDYINKRPVTDDPPF